MSAVAHRSLAGEIVRVARLGNLTAAQLARATGAEQSSARRWMQGDRAPAGEHAERALELAALTDRLAVVMDAAYIPVWLSKPIARLDDRVPLDVIREGGYREVSRVVSALETTPVSQVHAPDVESGDVHGVFYRHIPKGADPLHEPEHPADGRWQRGRRIEAWYLADESATVWAEWQRALAALGLPPALGLPRDLWRWQIDLQHVALLDSVERLARVGLQQPVPSESQWPACQHAGESLRQAGYWALLVPSAARPEHRNLVVFRTARQVAGCVPVPPPETIEQAPAVPTGMRT